MRILQVHNINQMATLYNTGLAQLGHTTALYEPCLKGGFAPLPQKLAMMPWRVLDMRHIVSKLHPDYFDIVHIHWATYGVLGLGSRVPYILHCHGRDVLQHHGRDGNNGWRHPLLRLILAPVLRQAKAVLCVTPDLLPVVRSVRPDAMFVPAPIDIERFAPLEGKQPGVARSWTILLFARLDPNKGVDVAMEGIERFIQRHPGVRVQLLDWGSLRTAYRERYGAFCEFIQRVQPGEVARLLLSADVIVGQFALGALGLSELQAMSCGKPVIASFQHRDAYPVPPPICQATTAEAVDAHLEDLFHHPEKVRSLAQQSREWVIKYHSSRVLTARLEKLYQSILA